MKKNKTIVIVTLIIILLGSFLVVYAYHVHEEQTNSIITFGNVKLKLIEKELKNDKYVDVNNNDSVDITNITKLDRVVKVKNIGKNPFYLRMQIVFNDTSNVNDYMKIEPNENWRYKDGYYYYENVVYPNEETNNLMNEIKINKENIIENYNQKHFYLKIKAQAVQSEHNVNNVMEVTNWPS